MSTILHSVKLECMSCCKCGMSLALNQRWVETVRSMGENGPCFWCPYCGVQQGWKGKSAAEKQIDTLSQSLREKEAMAAIFKSQRDNAEKEAAHFRRSRDGMKGQLVKVKKRIAKGVCPCCNRTFANLARHMQTKQAVEISTKEI